LKSGSAELSKARDTLIGSLKAEGILKSKVVEDAIRAVRKEDFLWEGDPEYLAYLDQPLSLGDTGQTISAPHMIVIMLEALELISGQKVLEIGTSSGYNAALMAQIVSQNTSKVECLVTSIERNRKLVEFAKRNLDRAGLSKIVNVVLGDGSLGYPAKSDTPIYDRITVTAAAPKIPDFLLKQLKPNGVLLAPVGNITYQSLRKIRKTIKKEGNKEKSSFESQEMVECMFVPLIGEEGFRV
jgi:protein-L-isoaspartate(D-aspartate) O-methyltransferase